MITCNEAREMSNKAIDKMKAEYEQRHNDFLNTTAHETIIAAAKTGSYTVLLQIPMNLDYTHAKEKLAEMGYEVSNWADRKLTISWK